MVNVDPKKRSFVPIFPRRPGERTARYWARLVFNALATFQYGATCQEVSLRAGLKRSVTKDALYDLLDREDVAVIGTSSDGYLIWKTVADPNSCDLTED